jgi:HlyD family secretion protein
MIRSDVSGDRSGELAGLDVQARGARQAIATAQERYASLSRMDQEERRNLQTRDLALARKIERTLELHGSQEKSERSAIALADKEIESLGQELEYRRKVQAVAAHAAQQVTKLVQTHAVSDLENLRIQLEADRARLELHKAERELSAANLKRNQLRTDQETHHTERSMAMDQLENERREVGSALATLRSRHEAAQQQQAELLRGLEETIAKCTIRSASLKGQLDRTTGNQVAVPAPCAGSVLRLRVKSAGAFVRTGDVLCELVGSGEGLEAELTVPPAGAGRIAAKQTVKLYYDAFPYQRHGVKYGTVRWVSPAGAGDNDHHDFRALAGCSDDRYIVDGKERKLRAGMCGRAEILVGRHALISYAFEPLRQLKESMDAPP